MLPRRIRTLCRKQRKKGNICSLFINGLIQITSLRRLLRKQQKLKKVFGDDDKMKRVHLQALCHQYEMVQMSYQE